MFYPVGNGDTSQIILDNGKGILLDFRHLAKCETPEVPEINLAARLREELKKASKTSFDVALTHGDSDHICGSTDFFVLGHAAKYQGGDRVAIDELWVPSEKGTQADRSPSGRSGATRLATVSASRALRQIGRSPTASPSR